MMDGELNQLILEIYDTIPDPGRWPLVLDRFAEYVGARGCIISEIEGIGDARRIVTPYLSTKYDEKAIQKYLESYAHFEFLDQARYEELSQAQRDAIDLIDQETLAGDDLEAFLARPNVKRMQAIGVVQRAGGLLDKDNTFRARFSVHFGKERGGFSAEKKADLGLLLPHIAKAIEIGRPVKQLEATKAGMVAAMNRFRMGVCILDRHGRVEAANDEFLRQVETYPQYTIDQNKRLHLHHSADHKRLNDMLTDTLTHGKHGARPRKEAIMVAGAEDVIELDDIGTLCVEVAPVHRINEIGTSEFNGAIVYSLDTSKPMPFDPVMMSNRFNLSKAETALLEMIANGLSNAQIADQRCRAVDTINAQVKALLSKTGAANRTHLVRLMACFGTDYLLPAAE